MPILKGQAISDQHSVELTREINEKSTNVNAGGAGLSGLTEGEVPEFKKGHCIASDESGAKKSARKTKV